MFLTMFCSCRCELLGAAQTWKSSAKVSIGYIFTEVVHRSKNLNEGRVEIVMEQSLVVLNDGIFHVMVGRGSAAE